MLPLLSTNCLLIIGEGDCYIQYSKASKYIFYFYMHIIVLNRVPCQEYILYITRYWKLSDTVEEIKTIWRSGTIRKQIIAHSSIVATKRFWAKTNSKCQIRHCNWGMPGTLSHGQTNQLIAGSCTPTCSIKGICNAGCIKQDYNVSKWPSHIENKWRMWEF